MEAKDAWILLGGAALGFFASLLATFTAPSVGNAFSKLKSGFIERNRARALAAYVEVHDLKSGKRDKYLYAITGWGSLSAFMIMCIIAGLMGFSTRRFLGPPTSIGPENASLLALALAVAFALVVLRCVLRLYLTLSRLDNFENYRAQLLRRWPDIVLPE